MSKPTLNTETTEMGELSTKLRGTFLLLEMHAQSSQPIRPSFLEEMKTIVEEAADALDAAEQRASSDVKVKPLEWMYREWAQAKWCASSVAGDYFIRNVEGEGFRWCRFLEQPNRAETFDEAKASCKADYRSRILSALDAASQSDGGR